ncbi:SMC5-SMC6 complex localization factor protein 2 [Labrus mixtus]|uniref:SMC5-SMC6 complex localization factor protein 2 n=1 Tax=Labrus mixtus TaxID=508554 RepID=UPI0029C009D3|nr:SMC5-SMC6 complex localization factor protein 2 [Labrus mixtus]
MRRTTENQGNTRTLADYYSPRAKGKDFTLQQRFQSHFTSFAQESPMKPSQVPNRLPRPAPRGMFPRQKPELYPVSPCPDQRHKRTSSTEKFIPAVDLNSSSLKRRRESEDCVDSAVNLGCENSCKAQTPRPTAGNSLRTSLVPSSRQSLFPEQSLKTTDNHPRKESVWGQSTSLRPTQCSYPSLSLVPCTKKKNPMGAKQAYVEHTQNHTLRLKDVYVPSREIEESLTQRREEINKSDKSSSSFSPGVPQKDNGSFRSGSHHSGHSHCSSSILPVKNPDRGHKLEENRKLGSVTPKPASKPNSDSLSSSAVKRRKTAHSRRPVAIPNDIDDLFTPDPMTYVVSPSHKISKQNIDGGAIRSPAPMICCSGSSRHEIQKVKITGSPHAGDTNPSSQVPGHPLSFLPTVTLMRVNLENLRPPHSKDIELKNDHITLSSRQPEEESVKANEKHTTYHSNNVRACTLETDPAASGHTSTHPCVQSPLLERQASGEGSQQVNDVRPVDVELDLDLSLALDMDLPQSSQSSEEEKLLSPQEMMERATKPPDTPEKGAFSEPGSGSLCRKIQKVKITGSPHAGDTNPSSQVPGHPLSFLPTVTLMRVNLENLRPPHSKDTELKNDHITLSSRQPEEESVKANEKHTTYHSNNVRACTLETDPAASGHTSTHPCVQSPLLASGEGSQQVNDVHPVDVELDLDLSLALDMDLTQSSQSSEEEQLLSLQEMMERATKPPDTPEKGAFSEPGTPGPRSCKLKTQAVPSYTKSGNYKNSLDQMLKEISTNKRSKEIETQLLTACKEDLLKIAEYEEAEESREEGITTEHQEFLQRFSLMSSAIREVPPGEMVFKLEKFGQIFNQNMLQLRKCMLHPEGAAQKTLLWSSPAQLRLHVNSGLFQEAYACHLPCPTQVTRFLFKMMSVHNERMLSENILQTLCDIASTAAYQIVKNGSQKFEVWVPSLADVALVLMNMGASFVTLFPFENLQPPFTEGDLLEDVYIKTESPSSNEEQSTFPEHNCVNVLKYLSYCMGLCPRAYSDGELLLLLTVLEKVGLDTQLILQYTCEMYSLQHKMVNNFRDWNAMMPRICLALTDLTDDHHNMCLLVRMLPDNTRGKQLRRHLSLSMISKLLDGNCTYTPTGEEIQLSELRRFLPRMQPSTLLRNLQRSQREKEDMATLDQQSYYLCYSLLTLANEVSNFQIFPAHQKEHLLNLCSELEMHVKCDIRESEKCLYRSKVKDLVARIYTKWQILLQKTRPLHGKLYDFWQPSSVDILTSSQEDQEGNSNDEGEEDEEKETREENEVEVKADEDEKEKGDDEPNKTGGDTERLLHNKETSEMEVQVNTESEVMEEHEDAKNKQRTEFEAGNDVETKESPQNNRPGGR